MSGFIPAPADPAIRYPESEWLEDFDALLAGGPADEPEFVRVTAYYRQTFRDVTEQQLALRENRNRLSAALAFVRHRWPELLARGIVIQGASGAFVFDPKARKALYRSFNYEPLEALRFDFDVPLLIEMMARIP